MWWSDLGSQQKRDRTPPLTSASEHIRRGIMLLNAAADGAGDEEITPSQIAEVIRDAVEESSTAPANVRTYLNEALDAVSDGMPADYVAMILYAALGAGEPSGR